MNVTNDITSAMHGSNNQAFLLTSNASVLRITPKDTPAPLRASIEAATRAELSSFFGQEQFDEKEREIPNARHPGDDQ